MDRDSINKLSRRRFLSRGASGLAAAGASISALAAPRPQKKLPNILWLVSADSTPLIGGGTAHTPNLDALAREGLVYRNAFSTASTRAPSRFGVLTGVYPQSCAPANHMRATARLPEFLRTYPEYLRAAGYYCTHNGGTDFNADVGPASLWDDSGDNAHWKARPNGKPFMAVFNLAASPQPGTDKEPRTDNKSMVLNSAEGRVTPKDVRIPAYLPDTPELRADFAAYYNSLAKMDAEAGARIDELHRAGVAADTLVFFYSDRGGALPRHRRCCYDESLRSALILRLPPGWSHLAPAKPGSAITAPVSLVDLAPTLLAIAGIDRPAYMQGTAFLGATNAATNPTTKAATNAATNAAPKVYAFGTCDRVEERYDFIRTATDGNFRYIRNYLPHRPWGRHSAAEWSTPGYLSWEREYRAGRLNADQARFFQEKPFEELYDLARDPDQVRNLAGDAAYADHLSELRKALSRHMRAINDNGFIPEGMSAEGYTASRAEQAYPLRHLLRLGAAAAQRNPGRYSFIARYLGSGNDIVRYWAVMGMLMLGEHAEKARRRLVKIMRHDDVAQIQVVAAEAVAGLAPSPRPIAVLADLLDKAPQWQVRLQALDALTALGEQARPALPAIKRAAESEQDYLRSAGRYLAARLEGG